MPKTTAYFLAISLFVCLISFASAEEYALDISIDKQKQAYSAGENVTFKAILLKDGQEIALPLKINISDSYNEKKIVMQVESNKYQTLLVKDDFTSGPWIIETSYAGKSKRVLFNVEPRRGVEFSIEGDKLIIRNSGNLPYTETIHIVIGDKVINQKQNIPVGEKKEIKLIAPEGLYNIEVSDDNNNLFKRGNVQLTGTGNTIGALDENLMGYSYLTGGVREGDFFFGTYSAALFIFIGAVLIVFILVLIERTMARRLYKKK